MSSFSLGLSEIIKINQLARDWIDLAGFIDWYELLSSPQQNIILTTQFEFDY